MDNRTLLEEKEAFEKRKQAAEERQANRERLRDAASQQDIEDTSALDKLLDKLRAGDSVGRRARRNRPSRGGASASTAPPTLTLNPETLSSPNLGGVEAVDLAMDMLATLKSDGFVPTSPTSSTSALPTTRRRRLRAGSIAADLAAATEGLEPLEEQQEHGEASQPEEQVKEADDGAGSPADSALRMLQALQSDDS